MAPPPKMTIFRRPSKRFSTSMISSGCNKLVWDWERHEKNKVFLCKCHYEAPKTGILQRGESAYTSESVGNCLSLEKCDVQPFDSHYFLPKTSTSTLGRWGFLPSWYVGSLNFFCHRFGFGVLKYLGVNGKHHKW